MNNQKQNLGQFNTKSGVWLRPHVAQFIKGSGCRTVVDPYAGGGDLLSAVNDYFTWYIGYDIDPELAWEWNDGLSAIPYHDGAMVVTNPPYLAKNSATRNCLDSYDYFKMDDNDQYEDLYQIALEKVLSQYKKAVFIIPETYFQTDFFKNHLDSYTIIEENPFEDTDCPVCVATFDVSNDFYRIAGNNYKIYKNDSYLFDRFGLIDILYKFNSTRLNAPITFNDPNGNLGLRGVDGVLPYDSIHFCQPYDLQYKRDIKESSRSITIINVEGVEVDSTFLDAVNFYLRKLRRDTHDVVLSPFKGNNKLGQRRRRLDYKWARKIIEKSMETLDK